MYIVLDRAYLVGYNSGWIDSGGVIRGFDFDRCLYNLKEFGLPAPKPYEHTDVMKIAERRDGKRRKLQTVFDSYRLSRDMVDVFTTLYFSGEDTAHTSGYDVVCTAILFNKLLDDDLSMLGNETMVNQVEDVWGLTFVDSELKAVRVRDGVSKLYNMDTLLQEHPDIFEYLMKDPYNRMIDYQPLTVEEGFVDV